MSERIKMRKKRTKQLEEAVWMARGTGVASPEDIEHTERQWEQFTRLGIPFSVIDDNPDTNFDFELESLRLEATKYILEDTPVPEELERKLLEKERLRKERELHPKQKKLSNRERKRRKKAEEAERRKFELSRKKEERRRMRLEQIKEV